MNQALKMALKSIAGNKLRSILTMLGIIIGVVSLVVLVSLVSGTTGSVTDAVSALGNNMLTVTTSDDKGSPVTLETLTEWSDTEGIGSVAPSASEEITLKHGSDTESGEI